MSARSEQHEGGYDHVKDGMWTAGYRGRCSCGWAANDLHPRPGGAIRDHFQHCVDTQRDGDQPVTAPPSAHHTNPDELPGGDW